MIETNIFRNVDFRLPRNRLKTMQAGAATTCYVAASPLLVGVSGYYFVGCNPEEPSFPMQDVEMAQRLREVSEDLVRDYLG